MRKPVEWAQAFLIESFIQEGLEWKPRAKKIGKGARDNAGVDGNGPSVVLPATRTKTDWRGDATKYTGSRRNRADQNRSLA